MSVFEAYQQSATFEEFATLVKEDADLWWEELNYQYAN